MAVCSQTAIIVYKKITMHKLNLLLCFLMFSSLSFAQLTVSPSTFDVDDEITITVDLAQNQCNTIPSSATTVYMHSGIGTNANPWGISVVGNWGQDDGIGEMTSQGNGVFSITITPSQYFNLTAQQQSDATQMGLVFRSADGEQEMKEPPGCNDFFVNVGSFQMTLTNPTQNSVIVSEGDSFTVDATASLNADFELFANGNSIHTSTNTTSYSHSFTVNEDMNLTLVATQTGGTDTQSESFNLVLDPEPQILALPEGMEDGINYDSNNADEITLVLYAPDKEFVHVASNLEDSDYNITNTYLMNFDPATDRHWITIDLSNHEEEHLFYEYVIENSFRVPDPYSRLSLNQFNDPFIISRDVFPGLPNFPTDKTENILTWVRLNQPEYEWQVTDFERPDREDLVIYEMLIRDFTSGSSFDAALERLNHIENLGVNAIELMPVSEFDNNISWGYNPSLHMSLDKYYGSPEAFKNFVDECHARGIAVILDVVYSHGTGQSPYYRMYNDCDGCFNGTPLANNPIFAQNDPNPTFSWFEKIDHNKMYTREWLDKMNKYWLEEFNIDGFRYDFTKGFTMNPGEGTPYDQQRIDNLTRMYDEVRKYDEDAYIILEHFAEDSEEQVLVNHRFDPSNANEGGMMVWSNVNFNYNQASMGYGNSNFGRVSYKSRPNSDVWSPHSVLGFMESHDEERLMFKNLQFGNSNGGYDVTELPTALERQKLVGAFYFTVPGPKMIWQFGELGYDYSIDHCEDGSIDPDCRTAPKPTPWGYLQNQDRTDLFESWMKLIEFKKQDPIFKTTNFTLETWDDVEKKIFLVNDNAGEDEIRYVTVVGNFGVNQITTQPFFQETGTWYNVLEETPFEVTDTNMSITLEAGEFIVFANNDPGTLSIEDFEETQFSVYPNPAKNNFAINQSVEMVEVFSLTGKKVKSFKGDFYANHKFDVSDLSSGVYLIKIQKNLQTETTKLIIE